MKKTEKARYKKLADENLSRKEWLQKTGKYAAFTAATMMMVLNPGKVSAEPSPPGGGEFE